MYLRNVESVRRSLYSPWRHSNQIGNPDLIGLNAQRPNPRSSLASCASMGKSPQGAENDDVTIGNDFCARIHISEDDTVRWRDDPHAGPAGIADNNRSRVFRLPDGGPWAFKRDFRTSPSTENERSSLSRTSTTLTCDFLVEFLVERQNFIRAHRSDPKIQNHFGLLKELARLLQSHIHEGHDGIEGGGRVWDQRQTVTVGFYLYRRRFG